MVSRKDEEGRILVVEEEKKKAKKIHDRTYDIIMSEKPQRHFHFRYVVYTGRHPDRRQDALPSQRVLQTLVPEGGDFLQMWTPARRLQELLL